MSDLRRVFDLKNLRRAYRWLLSNPDPIYKEYFRDAYDAFALASETHLKWIRNEGIRERYQASHASKVMLPKASGSLRSITLLTVEDQIVYQACVNIVAEALYRRTRRRHETVVFAHLYGGKSSPFFISGGKLATESLAKGYGPRTAKDLHILQTLISHHFMIQLTTMYCAISLSN